MLYVFVVGKPTMPILRCHHSLRSWEAEKLSEIAFTFNFSKGVKYSMLD